MKRCPRGEGCGYRVCSAPLRPTSCREPLLPLDVRSAVPWPLNTWGNMESSGRKVLGQASRKVGKLSLDGCLQAKTTPTSDPISKPQGTHQPCSLGTALILNYSTFLGSHF